MESITTGRNRSSPTSRVTCIRHNGSWRSKEQVKDGITRDVPGLSSLECVCVCDVCVFACVVCV